MPRGISKGPARHRTDVLFELADDAGFEGPVSRIVDSWCNFIDKQASVARREKFDGQHADILKRLRNAGGNCFRLFGLVLVQGCRNDGTAENVLAVYILGRIVRREIADVVSGGNHGAFEREVHASFDDGWSPFQA